MTRPSKLGEREIAEAIAKLPRWSVEGSKLHREYRFASFSEAFGFMAAVALVAERMDHHPEWFNVYSTVRVHLATHDAGGITALDFTLAERMEALAARFGQ